MYRQNAKQRKRENFRFFAFGRFPHYFFFLNFFTYIAVNITLIILVHKTILTFQNGFA